MSEYAAPEASLRELMISGIQNHILDVSCCPVPAPCSKGCVSLSWVAQTASLCDALSQARKQGCRGGLRRARPTFQIQGWFDSRQFIPASVLEQSQDLTEQLEYDIVIPALTFCCVKSLCSCLT